MRVSKVPDEDPPSSPTSIWRKKPPRLEEDAGQQGQPEQSLAPGIEIGSVHQHEVDQSEG